VKPHEVFNGVYWAFIEDGSKRLATLNYAPGRSVYGERLIKFKKQEYRLWDPFRSKLAAAIYKGLKVFPFKEGTKVLYIGAATGTTASHISDIISQPGRVYCVEFAQRVMRELISNVTDYRPNMIPILADARFPNTYRIMVEKVETIYCDIAQPEQAKILADNAKMFLKEKGWILFTIKARSIDVTKEPEAIFRREINILQNRGFTNLEKVDLEPYDRAHTVITAQFEGINS
jgi:fibrillarin-like pre-rRNA processing protein